MSISDQIVVMKDGVLQQIGKPQEVYDCPKNLFVAKFLGTPPINVFDGKIAGGRLYVGDDAVLSVKAPDGEVTIGIRPEGFVPDPMGPLSCEMSGIEVMGRDLSVLAKHPASHSDTVRAILASDAPVDPSAKTVRFFLKPAKVSVFDKRTQERIDM